METTGAIAVLTRMGSGAVIPSHWRTKADETVFMLDGDFVEDGESYGPGSKCLEFGRIFPNTAKSG